MNRRYVEVALPPPFDREYTYGLPPELESEIQAGSLVLVPVQSRLVSGVVVAFVDPPPDLAPARIRDLVQLVAGDPLLNGELIELCRWMANYYFAALGNALTTALPPGIRINSNRLVSLIDQGPTLLTESALAARLVDQLRQNGPLKVTTLQSRLGKKGLENVLLRLKRSGAIDIQPVVPAAQVSALQRDHLRLVDADQARQAATELASRAPKQAACLQLLLEQEILPKKTLVDQGFSYPLLKTLEKRGLIENFDREVWRDPLAHVEYRAPAELAPTPDQQRVLEPIEAALDARTFYPALLQGVTGSGKTLVYIRAVAHTLAQGRAAIVLVPEIALAWQMVRHFKGHFGDQVAVMHSQLSDGERYDTWRRLYRGQQRVVIGARSAVLAPVEDLGLLIVDEEHDTSYKQEDLDSSHPLPYNARDLALVRGQRQGAVVLLGSATPSLESYHNARNKKYHHLILPRRVDDRPLPQVEVVDMRREPYQKKQRAIFSHSLRKKIKLRLERGEKIVLLQNRRGFVPWINCADCGEAIQCPSCKVSLTYHRTGRPELRCHYCDFRRLPPTACPDCGSAELRFEGVGTQKVEDSLEEQFPGIRVIRMDVDTTGWKGAHDHFVERFRSGQADVLLGTQMVAKGLDFPEVTLVGVISADTGMHMPDFRAAERSFQLITQVAGRSGRGDNPGEVVVQTSLPEAPVLQTAARQDFDEFAARELDERREAQFPPFGRLIGLGWRGPNEDEVADKARQCVALLQAKLLEGLWILGPAPAPLARLRGHYRWQALLCGASARQLHTCTAAGLPALRRLVGRGSVVFTINVDPSTMM
ncbi:MAG: primosomal protein N' [Candidatus Latescibacteria bacterium]|nr:primosomal protein N' [Candidatus Latescibacterota bacterium]